MRSSSATSAPRALFALAAVTAAAAWPIYQDAFPLPPLEEGVMDRPFVYERPQDAMVDVTNRLGVCILEDKIYSGGNFAFSPYGTASVLVVLYEGACGESGRQIHEALRLPMDRDVTRVGFRDIHRHLRSYFTYAGYLSGMTLSTNQTALRPDFERLLQFYGYDLDEVMGPAPSDSSSTEGLQNTTDTSANATGGTTDMNSTDTTTDIASSTSSDENSSASDESSGASGSGSTDASSPSSGDGTTDSSDSTSDVSSSGGSTDSASSDAATTTASSSEESSSASEDSSGASGSGAQTDTTDASSGGDGTTDSSDSGSDASADGASSPASGDAGSDSTDASGGSDSTDASGGSDSAGASGGSDSTDASGGSDSAGASGGSDSTDASGGSDAGGASGGSDSTDAAGGSDSTDAGGSSDSAGASGASDAGGASGGSDSTDAAGGSDSTDAGGSSDSAGASGASDAGGASGGSDSTDAAGGSDSTDAGGSSDSAGASGASDSGDASGASDAGDSATTEASGRRMGNMEGEEPADRVMVMKLLDPSQEKTTEARETAAAETTTISQEAVAPDPLAEIAAASEVVSSQNKADGHGMMMALMDMMRQMMPDAQVTDGASADAVTTTISQTSPSEGHPAGAETLSVAVGASTPMTAASEGGSLQNEAGETGTTAAYAADEPPVAVTVTTAMVQPVEDAAVAAASEVVVAVTEPETTIVSPRVDAKEHVEQAESSSSARAGRRGIRSGAQRAGRRRQQSATHARRQRDVHHLEEVWPGPVPAAASVWGPRRRPRWLHGLSPGAYANRRFGQQPCLPFLVNGQMEKPVPVMTFASVFPYAVIPQLDAQVLVFPLDDERYRLMLVLPLRQHDGLIHTLRGLRSMPLRQICTQLRPTRVHAVIPSFMVDDYVTLTPTLQKLGICDVFDPQRADLCTMSDDRDLFVRNIEQSITVVIRNYVEPYDIHRRQYARRTLTERFIALYPFLFFVVDTDTAITLVAGKIVDPTDPHIL